MKSKTGNIGIIIFIAFALLLIGACVQQNAQQNNDNAVNDTNYDVNGESNQTQGNSQNNMASSQKLKKISSIEELNKILQQAQQSAYSGGYYARNSRLGIETISSDSMTAEKSSGASLGVSSGASGSSRASTYSQTNIQVQGVDEPDFVKNDDKYIYQIVQNNLVIAQAYPAENAKVLSKTKINGTPSNIFLNKDKLIVFITNYETVYVIQPYNYYPTESSKTKTHALVYDVSDRENPKLAGDYDIDGYYYDARMIEDNIYFIAQDYAYYGIPKMPEVRANSKVLITSEIYYFDNPENNYNLYTVASLNINSQKVDAKTFMLGYGTTLYVSENNIYIAYQRNQPYWYYRNQDQDRFFKVVVPLLPEDAGRKILAIKSSEVTTGSDASNQEDWNKISLVMEDMYNNMDESEKKELISKIDNAVQEYEMKKQEEQARTVIQKIKIENGKIEYQAKGEVSGYLLNQFSLDEHEENLRVATTKDVYNWKNNENKLYNNVYVLDKDMNTVGKLEKIAPDERIYSTRFIQDKLYMVTFQRIDPLLVIDLSNPASPSILGELKIPGFSDYLHPYDENHIIGIGKDTETKEWGGVLTKGVKIALFDVSDVKNPKQVSEYVIGKQGTDSEALYDHKAFLFDKEKSLLVIPIRDVQEPIKFRPDIGYGNYKIWQGAYAFTINDSEIKLRGKVTHANAQQDLYYYRDDTTVRRSLFMDDVLYTVSNSKIKMNDLENVDKEINTVKLPYEQQVYPYPVYAGANPGSAQPIPE